MKTKLILFCLLTLLVTLANSQSAPWPYVVPTTGWINYYSQTDGVESAPSAIDGNSNVYTTGYSGLSTSANLIALKYDSTGTLQYSYSYNNGSSDLGTAIKVDATGKAYIAGVSTGTTGSTQKDYVIIKLNSSGVSQWVKRFDRGVNKDDEASAICVDNSGNVYVTGKSKNSSNNYDIVTLKLDGSNGNTIWSHIYSGSGLDDIGRGLVLSQNGQYLYITGSTNHSTQGWNIVTYALNSSSGASYWSPVTSNGNTSGSDLSKGIALSGTNVIVCGEMTNSGTGVDYTVIKYSGSSGSISWQNTYDYSNYANRASGLAVDSSGNIGVTGVVYNGSTYEYHTIFYTSTGTQYASNIEATGLSTITIEPNICNDTIAHHWYVCGEKQSATKDIFAYQITPSGNTAWSKLIDGQSSNVDASSSILVNGIGVVYVAGLSKNSTANYDYTTIKISQTPVYFPIDTGIQEIRDPNFVFQENRGQLIHPNGLSVGMDTVTFYNQGSEPAYYFNNNTVSHLIHDRDTIPDSLSRVDLRILNSNQYAEIFRYDQIDARKHYFTSSPPIVDVLSYRRLFVPEIKPNVDLHYYSNTRGLKSYYVFKTPSESIPDFVLKIEGANTSTVNGTGNLIATTNLGNINIGVVTAYQATYNPSSPSTPILIPLTASWHNLGNNQYRFNVTGYMPFWPVVVYVSKPGATSAPAYPPIDNLQWSSFIGSSNDDRLLKCRVDAKDNFYVVGYSSTGTYPVTSGNQIPLPANYAARMAIMSKFDNLGVLKYSTYLGANNGINYAHDIAVDSSYQMYVVGRTTGTNMITQFTGSSPTLSYSANSSTVTPVGSSLSENAFLIKLSPAGNTMRMCSYFGGSNQERFSCIKYWNGQIHIGGWSQSANIPILATQSTAYTTSIGTGMYLHLDTTVLLKHITKLQHPIVDLDIDNNGNTYLISSGTGALVPIKALTVFSHHVSNAGMLDWVLQSLNQNDSLIWSTYVGGSFNDEATGICIKDSILVIIGGGGSTNFPIIKNTLADSGDVAPIGNTDLQIMKFNRTTGHILWSVYQAGIPGTLTHGVGIDKNYNLYISGTTGGVNIIHPIGLGGYYQQNTNIGYDGYLIGYTNKNSRRWSSYLGSQSNLNCYSSDDFLYGMAISQSNRLYVCGYSEVVNNSFPLAQWNSSCYFDPTIDTITTFFSDLCEDGIISMFTIPNLTTVGLEDVKNVKNINLILYPNPNSGKFNLRLSNMPNEKVNISVTNIVGQQIYKSDNVEVNENDIQLDLVNLSKGIYLISLKTAEKTRTAKFVVE